MVGKTPHQGVQPSGLKVGDSGFLRDDERRHDTGMEISITNWFDSYKIYLPLNWYDTGFITIMFDKNDVYLSSNFDRNDGLYIV